MEGGTRWPEDSIQQRCFSGSITNKLFYSYMSQILRKGAMLHRYRRGGSKDNDAAVEALGELSQDDLYQPPKKMTSMHLRSEFRRLRKKQQSAGKPGSPRSAFLRILWGLAAPTFVPAAGFQLIQLLSQIAVPLIVREVLVLLEENPAENFARDGVPLAVGLFVASVVDGISLERQKYLAFQSGIVLKNSIINAVYDHVLALTPSGKSGLTSGETTNLVAIDAQKLFEITQEGHQIWSCPLAMVIVTILLLLELGPVTLVGMASMVMLVPVVQKIVTLMMQIRRKRVAETDRRVEATTAMLQGVKFTKLNHYEDKFLQRVNEARKREARLLRKELGVLAVTMFLTVISPVLASAVTFATYVLIDDGNTLSASTAFTTLYFFAILRFPINYVGVLMGKAAQGLQACQRFAEFFEKEASLEEVATVEEMAETDDMMVKVVDGSFSVGSSSEDVNENTDHSNFFTKAGFTVSNINFTVKRSEILCVVGPVASGKSTLCHGLIGDLPSTSSILELKGKVAYASQTPFILNATVRDNILFGNEYEQVRYEQVLEACCLTPDLDQIGAARDLTEIGERGVTLSGGQKQRVSLARVAYSQPDVAIFDDPLSALDAATGKSVFEKLFRSETGPLSKTAIVLVTHASHFLNRVDQIMVLLDGEPAFMGKWNDLASFHPTSPDAEEKIAAIRTAVQEEHTEDEDEVAKESGKDPSDLKGGAGGDLMTTEEREFGLSDWRTWFKWFKYAGGFFFVISALLLLGIDRFAYVATEWWIASWTSGETEAITRFGREFPPQTDGISAQAEYLTVYAIILVISFSGTILRTQWLVQAGARCSDRLFALMTSKVVRAPMSYFETTPLGRILNRFTYDMEALDVTLTKSMTMLMTSLGWFVTGVVLQVTILPWQMFVICFIMVIYWLLLLHYRKSAVDLQRLDAVSRSPVQAQLSEVLDGASTIRVFHKVPFFSEIFRSSLDQNTSAMMNFMAAHRWLSVRIQLVGSCAVLFSVCFIVSFNSVLMISPGIAAMLVIWSSNFTVSLGFMIQSISEAEAALTSVERVAAMTDLPQEKDTATDDSAIILSKDWPSNGSFSFDNVTLRYRPELPLSLDGLSFSLKSGQRCGVVGRTGAGKSTLTVALFRLVEIESGTITLDGVDLSKVGLADVRGRKNGMCIIPQDPVLFSGSLRECLDPFSDSTGKQVLEALKAVRVGNALDRGVEALKDRVDEGGRNYGVGERQLLCLARAILAKPKVLILDEATASVDGETDAFIQRMIRSRFQGTTLLTIAHRLNTIMDYDVILAMDNGKAAEFGSPSDLLEGNGLFSSLVDSTGKQSSKTLRRISQSLGGDTD